jgi:hypothetical protein
MLDGCDALFVIRSMRTSQAATWSARGRHYRPREGNGVLLASLALEMPLKIGFVVHNVVPPDYSAVCFRNSATSRAAICDRWLPKRAVT